MQPPAKHSRNSLATSSIRNNPSDQDVNQIRKDLNEVLEGMTSTYQSKRTGYEAIIDEMTQEERESAIFSREFKELKLNDYESLYKDDLTGAKQCFIENVLKEYEYLKYNSVGKVASDISLVDMERFLEEGQTLSAREKLFNYFYKREMVKRCQSMRKKRERAEKQAIADAKTEKFNKLYGGKRTGLLGTDNQLIYGLWHNSLFCRIPENKIKSGLSSSRLIEASLFGPKLVFDFDFESFMAPWIYRNVLDQVQESYGLNRYHYKECFDIWFCNFDENSPGADFLKKNALRNLFTSSLIEIKKDCFTNYFDKSRLVYLSPNAKEKVTSVGNNDDVYIIGVYNDKGCGKPLTFRKAAKLGIRSMSLPLDSYIAWQGGSKSLCVNHVTGILLEVMANGGDWRKAFIKHIPARKIKPVEVVIEEEERRLSRMRQKRKMTRFSIREDLDLS